MRWLLGTKIGMYLFKIYLGLVYDVFWIIGYAKGVLRRYFGGDDE